MRDEIIKEGDFVVCWKDGGEALLTKARSDEFLDVNKRKAIFLEGISGYYALTHVRHLSINGGTLEEQYQYNFIKNRSRAESKVLQPNNVL
jgi:hypothetical protein